MLLHIAQVHLSPPLYKLMKTNIIGIDTNVEQIFIGESYLLYWETYSIILIQVEFGNPS